MVLVGVVATAEKRGEGVPLVCPLVAQMTLSMASTQGLTLRRFRAEADCVRLLDWSLTSGTLLVIDGP